MAVFFTLMASAAGVLLFVGIGIDEILQNAYLSLHFWRNAFIEIRNHSVLGGLVGSAWGFCTTAIACFVIHHFRSMAKKTPTPEPWRVISWDASVCFGFLVSVLLILGLHETIGPEHGAIRIWGAVGASVVWCVAFASQRRVWLGALPRVVGFFSFPLVVNIPPIIVFALFFLDRNVKNTFRQPATVVSAIVAGALFSFALYRHQFGSYSPAGDTSQSRVRPWWVILLPLIAPVALLMTTPVVFPSTTESADPRHIVLIGIDTLRWDHVSYSSADPRNQTPNIRSLAERGIRFDLAISQAPWTMPAFASIFTGRYPHEHGAISLSGILEKREITLPEIIRENGYLTAGFVSHFYVDSDHGFSQGFDHFSDHYSHNSTYEITGGKLTNDVLRFLERYNSRPFFLFVHYFDPHYIYIDHQEFSLSDDYSGWLKGQSLRMNELRDARHRLDRADVDFLKCLYDEEIAFVDKQVGRIVSSLDDLGIADETAIVVLSDHGEEFLERQWIGHTTSLYDELIRVPMIVVLPDRNRSREVVESPVETRSIIFAIADYLGLNHVDRENQNGLSGYFRGGEFALQKAPERAFSQVWLPDAPLSKNVTISAVREARWKVIIDSGRGTECAFDLESDPLETQCLAVDDREATVDMAGTLRTWIAESAGANNRRESRMPDDETTERLRELGYIR
jgi:arylsulfatase A-like enzyme